MPKSKNLGKHKSRYEVRGGLLNEYEFALNEGSMTEEERNPLAQMEEQREGEEGGEATASSPQEREAARIREVIETAHEKAQRHIEKRQRREGGSSKSARKGAAGKAAKAGAKKGAGKKAGGGKSAAAKKSGTGKAGKKNAGKKSAKKSAGRKAPAKKGAGKGARKRG
jgi:hypothetical protein